MAKSYAEQLKIAEKFLSKMASSTGALEQCRVEWGNKYQEARNAGLMKESSEDILAALKPTATKMVDCENNMKQSDKATMKHIIEELSKLAKTTSSVDSAWNSNFTEGKKRINVPKKYSNSSFNDYNVQAEIIGVMIDIADAVDYFIKQIRRDYDEFVFTAQQQSFMKQYTKELDNLVKSRTVEFDTIKNNLSITKDQITKIFLEIKLIAQSYSTY